MTLIGLFDIFFKQVTEDYEWSLQLRYETPLRCLTLKNILIFNQLYSSSYYKTNSINSIYA